MDRPIIIARRVLQELEFAGLFPLSGYDMLDDVLLPYLSASGPEEAEDGLRLAVVVVMRHGSQFLIIEDEGKYSMGIVRECFHPKDETVRSLCSVTVAAAQTLAEYYLAGAKYSLDILGLMQCEQQGLGREWLGCLFIVETGKEIEPRRIGTKNISMMDMEQIRELLGADWGLDIATLARACAGLS